MGNFPSTITGKLIDFSVHLMHHGYYNLQQASTYKGSFGTKKNDCDISFKNIFQGIFYVFTTYSTNKASRENLEDNIRWQELKARL